MAWYCAFIVFGGGRANIRSMTKMTPETTMASVVYQNTFLPWPGGSRARGPWGPKAIQYAAQEIAISSIFKATAKSGVRGLRNEWSSLDREGDPRHGPVTRCYVPAFFSWSVISCQLTFIRSLKAIHKSACCCGGMASHRFSMPTSVGFDMA